MSVENVLEEVQRDPAGFHTRTIDALVRTAVFESDAGTRNGARNAIRKAAAALGILPASIQDLYMAMGRGGAGGVTPPPLNPRMLTPAPGAPGLPAPGSGRAGRA